MLKRLTAAASLATAFSVAALAATAAAAQGARDSARTPPPASQTTPAPTPMPFGDPKPPAAPAATAEVDYDRPFHPREVAAKALVTSKPEPGFTEEARENDTVGLVRLRAVFSKDGRVTHIRVIKGLPDGLTEKAIAAARGIKFRPARKDGRAVSQWVTLEYNFNIYNYPDEALLERKAVILERPEPEYTPEARRQEVGGTVVLDVMLTRKGVVRVTGVVSGLPHGLTEKAVEAAGRIKFTPAEDKGKKVTVMRRLEYVFSPGPRP